jgi:hypothetical protein
LQGDDGQVRIAVVGVSASDVLIGDCAEPCLSDPCFGQSNIFFRNIDADEFPLQTFANDAGGARFHKGITDQIAFPRKHVDEEFGELFRERRRVADETAFGSEMQNVGRIDQISTDPIRNLSAETAARRGCAERREGSREGPDRHDSAAAEEKTPSLSVPAVAIIFNRNGMQVAVVSDGKAEIRKVGVKRDLGTRVEVDTGIKAGDQVILNPPVTLIDGRKVLARPEAASDG